MPGGLVLAAGAFSLAGMLPDEAFLAWGWRACFLVSIALLGIGAYIRLSVMETPEFAKVQERKEISRLPLRDLLREQPRPLLLGMGTRYIEGFTFNLFSVYLLAYVATNLELPRSWALDAILVGAALGVVLVPIAGALCDRVGRKPVYRVGAWIGLLFAFPAACLVQTENRWAISLVFVVGLGVIYGDGLRPARCLLVRAVRHPLPLHGAQHALPGLRHPRVRADAAHRGVAGHPRRRDPVVGRDLQRGGRRDLADLRAVPARDPRPRARQRRSGAGARPRARPGLRVHTG